eukprot:1468693-Prymnesium_polylepis.1
MQQQRRSRVARGPPRGSDLGSANHRFGAVFRLSGDLLANSRDSAWSRALPPRDHGRMHRRHIGST